MKVVSLFDGISCGRVALECAGIEVEHYAAYEIDKYAMKVSFYNYPDIEQMGSVVNADFTPFKGFDLVMGGFPCTDLSIAKNGRKGLAGAHSSLFWELVRAIREIKPRYFLVENNASMPAADKAIISKALGVEPIMINSALVSAQQRKRLYWTNIPNVSQPADKGLVVADILESGIAYQKKAHALTVSYNNAIIWNSLERHQRSLIFEPVCLNPKSGRGGKDNAQPSLQDRIYSIESKHPAATTSFMPKVAIPKENNTSCNVYRVKDKAIELCVKGVLRNYKIDLPDGDYIIRKLTPVECERLQTLPDNYTAGISNTQRYKCLGNGWTVDVIAHILGHIKSN